MVFSKVRMGKEEIFTTVVEDMDGRELERWKVMKQDYPKVVGILSRKFGLNMKVIPRNKDKNFEKQNEDKDLEWTLK